MLSYTFWHWKRADVVADDYEAHLARFHEALNASPPPGLRATHAFAIAGAPWANDWGAAYEDWYLVDGSAALDPLNDAAVSAARQAPHDAVAAVTGGGTAGLYRLRLGAPVAEPRVAAWFAKPAGTSYLELFQWLSPVIAAHEGALWGRQMTLGPTPEFCLQLPAAVALDRRIAPLEVPLRRVWKIGA